MKTLTSLNDCQGRFPIHLSVKAILLGAFALLTACADQQPLATEDDVKLAERYGLDIAVYMGSKEDIYTATVKCKSDFIGDNYFMDFRPATDGTYKRVRLSDDIIRVEANDVYFPLENNKSIKYKCEYNRASGEAVADFDGDQ